MKKILFVALLFSCNGNGRDYQALQAAIDSSQVSIGDMVTVAETAMPESRALTAELHVAPVYYSYETLGADALADVRVDTIDGHIVSSAVAGSKASHCPDSISLQQAISIAEGQITGGHVIAAIPDDDVACAREIQVLAPDLLWEVKVGGAGEVLEVEESDEYTGEED